MKYCYSCFGKYEDDATVCPHCGQNEITEPNEPIHLVPGTVLAGRYVIGLSIGEGGFGIVYKAWDSKLGSIKAVKEFFVTRLMQRAKGLTDVIVSKQNQADVDIRKDRFLAEARTMAKFGNNDSIPNVFDFFEENKTAYIVMELLVGETLSEYLAENNMQIEPSFALYIVNETGKALKALHAQKIIHRDVAPDNIFICSGKDLRIKLMDLGAARLVDSSDNSIDTILKPGYSPAEQYADNKDIGPWSDVYALGATLYLMLTGEKPEESTNRKIVDSVKPVNELNSFVSENLSNATMKAMAVDKHMRFKSVSEFLSALNGERKVLPLEKEKKQRKVRRISGMLIAGALLAVIGLFLGGFFQSKRAEQTLKSANISIWFPVENGSSIEESLKEVFMDFSEKNPAVRIEYRAIPANEYTNELSAAASNNALPNLFISTGIENSILDDAIELDRVLQSPQRNECLFLEYYNSYYSDTKRMPLAFEIPVAYVITSGNTQTQYSDDYFNSISDFGDVNVSIDSQYSDVISENFGFAEYSSSDEFFNDANTSPVLLSSTMRINKVRALNYEKRYVYYDNDQIKCRYTFEWSVGNGAEDEIKASETLLSWLLGNVYQRILMVNSSSGGQVPEIPLNKECFETKIDVLSNLKPIKAIYSKFCFGNSALPSTSSQSAWASIDTSTSSLSQTGDPTSTPAGVFTPVVSFTPDAVVHTTSLTSASTSTPTHTPSPSPTPTTKPTAAPTPTPKPTAAPTPTPKLTAAPTPAPEIEVFSNHAYDMRFSLPKGFEIVPQHFFDDYYYVNESKDMNVDLFFWNWQEGDLQDRYASLCRGESIYFPSMTVNYHSISNDRFHIRGYGDGGRRMYYIFGIYSIVHSERVAYEFYISYPASNKEYGDYAASVLTNSVTFR